MCVFHPTERCSHFWITSRGDDGRVVIVDRNGNRKLGSSFYSTVEGLAWSPNGKEVWYSAAPNGASRAIYALGLDGKEGQIYRAPGGLTLHDISRNGHVLLTADKLRMGIAALPPGESQERSLSWFDWSADGKTIVFSESGEAMGTDYAIFLRKTDGSPAIRLGDGTTGYLSPDGQLVLATVGSPEKTILLPTGVGEPRQLLDDKSGIFDAAWMPDGKSIVYAARPAGREARSYLLDIQGGAPRALTPEGTAGTIISPDGNFLLAGDAKRQYWLYPLAGGEPKKTNLSLKPNEGALRFLDSNSVLIGTVSVPMDVMRADLATGQRQPWKRITPADPSGVQNITTVKFSADGKAYAYSIDRILSDLFVVDGLK